MLPMELRRKEGGTLMTSRTAGSGQHPKVSVEDVPTLPVAIQDHLGEQLRALYSAGLAAALPASLVDLVARLEASSLERSAATAAFRKGLIAALPKLRGFAVSLAGAVQADDLIQETMLKAWANQHRFEPSTNLDAWLLTILRNLFYSQIRKRKREVEDVNGEMASQLIEMPQQEPTVMLRELARHLGRLPARQRECLVLVGAEGLTYEAAAAIVGCQVGTVKSRVSRARAMLADTLMPEPANG